MRPEASPKLALIITDGAWSQVIEALRVDGYVLSVKSCPEEALSLLADVNPDVVVLATAMEQSEQLEFLDRLQECPQIIVLGPELKPNAPS